jgi:hypothetical protein
LAAEVLGYASNDARQTSARREHTVHRADRDRIGGEAVVSSRRSQLLGDSLREGKGGLHRPAPHAHPRDAELLFDSNANDVAVGATPIATDLIQGNPPAGAGEDPGRGGRRGGAGNGGVRAALNSS